MQDIHIIFNGAGGASIDLEGTVAGNKQCEQECLVNLATEQGSDPLYGDRGTELLEKAVSGAMVGENDAIHAGNFAALDTIRFVVEQFPADEEWEANFDDETPITSPLSNLDVTMLSVDSGVVSYGVQIEFTDGTTTDTIEASIALDR